MEPSYRQIEYDEFDTPAATYILTVDEQHRTLGSVRLIPTTRPYMVESLWPNLVNTELPHCASVWEASRFGCDRDLDAASRRCVVAQLILGCRSLELQLASHSISGSCQSEFSNTLSQQTAVLSSEPDQRCG
jgi:N-acyl-L-homoserine lactone synthetase